MDPWQLAQQIKHKLQTVTWPEETGTVVFGTRGVVCFAGAPTEEQLPAGYPWALVGIGPGSPDESSPDLISQQFSVTIGVDVKGDPMGEHSVIGGSVQGLSQSAGRGIAEVAERGRAALEDLTGADGASVYLEGTSYDSPDVFGRGRHITIASSTYSGWCTSRLYYAAPQQIAWANNNWTWEGGHCSSRFDFLQYRLVRKSGSSAPANPSDGTTIYAGTAATYQGARTSGNTYGVFCDYNARGRRDIEGSSSPVVGSYLVVS